MGQLDMLDEKIESLAATGSFSQLFGGIWVGAGGRRRGKANKLLAIYTYKRD